MISHAKLLIAKLPPDFPIKRFFLSRWFKEDEEQLAPVTLNERISEIAQGLLHISKVKLEDQGKYLCWVNNSAGEETVQVNLTVTGKFSFYTS